MELARRLDLIDRNEPNFVWIHDFPFLNMIRRKSYGIRSSHVYLSPAVGLDKLDNNPEGIKARAYDLVLNGTEIGEAA